MKDDQHITAGYAEAIVGQYKALSEAYFRAAGDAAKEKKADQLFRDGLAFHRRVRDRALKLLVEK